MFSAVENLWGIDLKPKKKPPKRRLDHHLAVAGLQSVSEPEVKSRALLARSVNLIPTSSV